MSSRPSIETLFLRNRYLLTLSIAVSIAAGLFGISRLPRFEDPRITNLWPIVVTPYPGASAARVETLVTEKLEEELTEVRTLIAELRRILGSEEVRLGILKDELAELADKYGDERRTEITHAIGAFNAYVNVHTTAHPTGEIRAQLH